MAEVEGARRGGANVRARRGSTAFVRHHAVALPIERSDVGVANEHGVPTYVRRALHSREYCCDCSAAYAHYAKPHRLLRCPVELHESPHEPMHNAPHPRPLLPPSSDPRPLPPPSSDPRPLLPPLLCMRLSRAPHAKQAGGGGGVED